MRLTVEIHCDRCETTLYDVTLDSIGQALAFRPGDHVHYCACPTRPTVDEIGILITVPPTRKEKRGRA